MKIKLLVIIFMLMNLTIFSQKLIEQKSVPEEVTRAFKKKSQGTEEVKWFLKDKNYLVKYTKGDYPGEILFTREGLVISTKDAMDPQKLPASIITDLSKTQKGKKIHEVFLITQGKKEKYYSIILHERQGRKQEPLIWEAQYTMQGKLITIYEPQKEETIEDTTEERPTKFTKTVDDEMDNLKERVKDEKISRKDLPSEAENYLSENFDYEYRAKEILVRNNTEYGQYYQVKMKKQGEKIEHIIFFDFKGNFIKRKEIHL